jgi:hypothetical protein
VTSDCRGRSSCAWEKRSRSRSHMATGAPVFRRALAGMRRACRAGRKPDWWPIYANSGIQKARKLRENLGVPKRNGDTP